MGRCAVAEEIGNRDKDSALNVSTEMEMYKSVFMLKGFCVVCRVFFMLDDVDLGSWVF